MTAEEVSVPYIIEDFEINDDVWRYNIKDKNLMLGIVDAIEGNCISVFGTDGSKHMVPVSSFGRNSKAGERWGKLLDTSLIREGTVLSRGKGKSREFWEVKYITPVQPEKPGRIYLVQEAGVFSDAKEFVFKNDTELQKALFSFELEP